MKIIDGDTDRTSEKPTAVGDLADWPLLICLLGGFRLLGSGLPIDLRNANKTRALLLNLALEENFTASRDALLQAIWPNSQTDLAGRALNSLIYSLHKLLGKTLGGAMPVVYAHGYYRLNIEAGITVDLSVFETLSREGQRHERAGQLDKAMRFYEQAIKIYQGDLCTVTDVQALMLCESLRARHHSLLARLADVSFSQQDYATCLTHASRLLIADPCREDAHRLIMRCCVRMGHRAQALHQYRLCENILRTEYDARPEQATEALYQQIRLDPTAV